jgi:hypothetical protein
MRLRSCLFVCTLVLVMPLIGLAQTLPQGADKVEVNGDEKNMEAGADAAAGGEAKKTTALSVPAPKEIMRKDAAYTSAYHDVYHILSGQNPCSSFFGGPSTAVEVLNNLFDRLGTTRLAETKTGLSMSGQTRYVTNARTGATYRLFEKAVINTSGPFYQRKFSGADPFVPNVGSFQANTREARAAILLHEMGHLLQGADGRWLLPNDGTSDEQSRKNTSTIETRCGEQIKSLQQTKPSEKETKSGAKASAPEKGNGQQ